MWIKYNGREWIVLHHTSGFYAVSNDEKKATEKEIQRLFHYLVEEGFINQPPNQPPNQYQTV